MTFIVGCVAVTRKDFYFFYLFFLSRGTFIIFYISGNS
jgi:hypothetical protein